MANSRSEFVSLATEILMILRDSLSLASITRLIKSRNTYQLSKQTEVAMKLKMFLVESKKCFSKIGLVALIEWCS